VSDFRTLAEECLRLPQVMSLKPQVLHDGSGWYVEVTWSDGGVEHIGTFGSESIARDWVEWDSPKFFRETSQR
jgi:hypothetical protein